MLFCFVFLLFVFYLGYCPDSKQKVNIQTPWAQAISTFHGLGKVKQLRVFLPPLWMRFLGYLQQGMKTFHGLCFFQLEGGSQVTFRSLSLLPVG